MPVPTASPPGLYDPYLTALDDAGGAVEVMRNLPDAPRPVKGRAEALERVIATIHERGLPLVVARELLKVTGGEP